MLQHRPSVARHAPAVCSGDTGWTPRCSILRAVERSDLVMLLALVAAFLFALSAYVQQRASRRLPGDAAGHAAGSAGRGLGASVALTVRLVRSPAWLLGWVVNLGGFLVQAAALRLGSVAMVQPLMPAQLLFAMPLAAWQARRWPTTLDWFSALAIAAGVGVLLVHDGAAPLAGGADRSRIGLVAVAAAVAVLALVTTARGRSPRWAAVSIACAAGACFAMSAVFMKLSADRLFEDGMRALVTDWPAYCLVVTTSLGLVLGQAAFAAGPLPWAVAAMNIVNPAVGYAVGVVAFHADPVDDAAAWRVVALAAALLVAGVIGLVTSSSRHHWAVPHDVPQRAGV